MAKRSLELLEQYRDKANNAKIALGLTQQAIANRLECSRQPVSRFFNCKPVSNELFVEICNLLKLDWQEITGKRVTNESDSKSLASSSQNINQLVTQLRQEVKADIKTRCGTMRIFDMTQPIGLGKIYTQVNILEKISGRSRKGITELLQNCTIKDFERFNLGIVTEEKIPGEDAVANHKRLLILGKPGAGKTTFLKHLAIQCNQGEFQGDLVPWFITLKDFAEADGKPKLLDYLQGYLKYESQQHLEYLLNSHQALILLDGLDEVLADDSKRVIKEIEALTNRYPQNQYVLTCRIAAREYTFEQFTEVEIADFDWEQITTFAHNWFSKKSIKAETFLNRLEQDKPIKELVSNPLLLTLLCISFEELGDFPANRKELYEEGLNALLRKWDSTRGIQRDKVYKPLSIAKKEDLLSQIAWKTFAPGEYFFKTDRVKQYISEYIRNLPGANLDDEALQGDSGIVLKNIEAQHGLLTARAKNIYSFSHLTFQEYFTAREIILVRQSSEEALQELVNHLFDKRWREVFFLATAMSPNAERLMILMKERIDNLLAADPELQDYLRWLKGKAQKVS
ncbi:MAG: NACHT domain-containing NTPase [Cyanobacteria bacterium J06558_2]